MDSDIIVVGGGASGLMAACGAAGTSVTVLEKMPRAGRKIMITGKGRCNFTNVKDWDSFKEAVCNGERVVKPAFFNLTPGKLIGFFESYGMKTVVERGDRAFPASHLASDVVDALVRACRDKGVRIIYGCEVREMLKTEDGGFSLKSADGRTFTCRKLIVATGGLSYPSTGSTGDGYAWAAATGHGISPTFPSLTALVPKGYKLAGDGGTDGHIERSSELTELGGKLCGIQLKNVGVRLLVQGTPAQEEFGDVDFTDGGLEGPVGFKISRKAVKSIINGSKVAVLLDLKQNVAPEELETRVRELRNEVERDPRSARLREKEKCRILLGKLMPWELIPAFVAMNQSVMTPDGKARTDNIARALKEWRFDIAGYVGYERCVITAGGVRLDDIVAKTLESRLVPGLHFCGEVLDIDCETGGYNLHCAFATGLLAGESAKRGI